jgi:hypothetical protein
MSGNAHVNVGTVYSKYELDIQAVREADARPTTVAKRGTEIWFGWERTNCRLINSNIYQSVDLKFIIYHIVSCFDLLMSPPLGDLKQKRRRHSITKTTLEVKYTLRL